MSDRQNNESSKKQKEKHLKPILHITTSRETPVECTLNNSKNLNYKYRE